MKRVKRLFACLLALTMMLGLSATAFAEQATGQVQTPTNGEVKFEKEYKLEGVGDSPAETFSFHVEVTNVTDASDAAERNLPKVGTVSYGEGDAGSDNCKKPVTVKLPTYNSVGIYYYTITETAGTTAGVDYDNTPVIMKVTVINGTTENSFEVKSVSFAKDNIDNKLGEGVAAFTNTYTANKLNVHKTVTGNLGDKSKYFTFKIKLEGTEEKTYPTSYNVTGGSKESNPSTIELGQVTSFELKHDETVTIANLPKGVKYMVTEDEASDYITTSSNNTTGFMDKDGKTVAFTNTKDGKIDTGVYLDNLPYILVFAGVLAIAVVFAVRRRRFED